MSLIPVGTTIARYKILGRLATGGMSELYLARHEGPLGFHKILVLKVILPHLAEDAKFVQMFRNEAKLAALLNHPNVVQVYDFGADQGVHFLAMEYIDGLSLRVVLERLQTEDERLPVHLACRVASDVCSALEYAHTLCDQQGQPLQIIHRDVSLENVLLSYTGQVKLVDFGLAKARTLISETTQGTLKGKYRYMAPEMLLGEAVDRRIDIFAMGVFLYALLVGKMPYDSQTHSGLFHQILAAPPPLPRTVDPLVPQELERVIMHALERERDRRYQSAGELQADLEQYMMRCAVSAASYHLAQFMTRLFPPGTDATRTEYQRMMGVVAPAPAAVRSTEMTLVVDPADLMDAPPGAPALADRRPTAIETSSGLRPEHSAEMLVGVSITGETMPGETMTDLTAPQMERSALIDRGDAILQEIVLRANTREEDLETRRTSAMPAVPLPSRPGPADHASARWRARDEASERRTLPAEASERRTLPAEASGALFRQLAAPAEPVDSPARHRSWLPVILVVVGASATAGGVLALLRHDPPPPEARVGAPAGPDSTASARLDAATAARREASGAEPGRADAAPEIDGPAAAPPDSAPRHLDSGRRAAIIKRPGKGLLKIFVHPWATVALDGKPLGQTPLPPIPVTEGTHELVVENQELGVKRTRRVRVKAGQDAVVKIKLE
jgi:serine/threonine-protein kinase